MAEPAAVAGSMKQPAIPPRPLPGAPKGFGGPKKSNLPPSEMQNSRPLPSAPPQVPGQPAPAVPVAYDPVRYHFCMNALHFSFPKRIAVASSERHEHDSQFSHRRTNELRE